jgi:hypothetical protein
MTRAPVTVAVLALLVTAGCGGSHSKAAPTHRTPATPPQLTSIAQLRSAFNREAGEPRLIVLISPT